MSGKGRGARGGSRERMFAEHPFDPNCICKLCDWRRPQNESGTTLCSRCGQPRDERFHNAITGKCLGRFE